MPLISNNHSLDDRTILSSGAVLASVIVLFYDIGMIFVPEMVQSPGTI
jgi:hypothetical protein